MTLGKQTLTHERERSAMQENKAKVEQKGAQQSSDVLAKALKGMEGMVQTLAQMVTEQAEKNQRAVETLAQAVMAPRKRTPVRGPDGRIAEVVDSVG